MKTRILLIFTMFALTATSCVFIFDCIEGNGDMQTEERTVNSFTSLANETSFYVEYAQDDAISVTVEAESNLLPHIETIVRNGCLEVRTTHGTGCVRYTVQPKITVTAPSIEELVNSGSGDIVAGPLEGNEVKVICSGSGDIETGAITCSSAFLAISGSGKIGTGVVSAQDIKATISGSGDITTMGSAETAKYIISGSGQLEAEDLDTDDADVVISGSGSMYVTVMQYLDAVISGSGNVFLHGDPEIKLTRSGSGRVIHQ